jgi:uncharacterized protein (DUF2147 family)
MKLLITIVTIIMMKVPFAQKSAESIIGNWISPKKDSEIQIFKINNKYFGKIVWGEGESTKENENPDSKLRNRDMTGLIILSNFEFQDDELINGTLWDPREGKTYSGVITIISKNEINIRGYAGLSLFGRSEVWTKSTTTTKKKS